MGKMVFLGCAAVGMVATACNCPQDCCDDGYFQSYGVTNPRHFWEESGPNGQVVKTLKDGVVCSQTYYCGKLEGDCSYTFPYSDNIEKVQTYSQDEMLKETTYHSNGMPRREAVRSPTENLTTITEWHEDGANKSFEKWSGNMLTHAEYYDNKQQRISGIDNGDGIRTQRDTYGLLLSTDNFKAGQVEYNTTYYPNGSPQEITPYKDGVVDGLRKTYYPGGEPKTIETWVAGKQQGPTTIFIDGQKSQEINYVDGVKNGKGRVFKDGDSVAQEMTWKNDKLHGPSTTYLDGRTVTEWYYKGNKVTKGYYDSFNPRPTPIDN